ncbi:MAG: hypothetical protein IKC80_00230 [Kiritimatiellae bacterium]|nr:hypothetical protein [Kiritimatiellia bacterium]
MKQKNELKSIKERNLTTGWLLCAAVVFSGLLPVSASPYEIEGTVLKITVPEGVTNEVEVSELVCANDNTVTEIRKLGRGGFLMNDKTAIPNYTGDIYVDQGTWIVACTNALGKLDVNNKGENTGKVYVADGASIDLASNDRYLNNKGKKITIKGNGVTGNGALTISVNQANYYNQTLGNNLVLTGDSSIWVPNNFNLYLLDSNIDLAGYKLAVKGDGGSSGNIVVGNEATVKSGTLEFVNKSGIVLQGTTTFDDGTCLIFRDESKMTVKTSGRNDAPVIWDSAGTVNSSEVVKGDITNTWHGPVRLDKTMRVAISKSGTLNLAGPVSGAGGLNMYWNTSSKPEVPTNAVTLANAMSTFKGGVSVRDIIVNVKEDGAVPAEGGVFALTNSIANFDTPKNYALPDGVIHVDGDVERSVSGGLGKWKTIVKTGTGTVNYDSSIGAEMLELREGVLKVSQQTVFAGLIEGVEYFTDMIDEQGNVVKPGVNISSSNAANDEIVYTNEVVMSPYLMNAEMKSYWTTHRPVWDTEKTIKAHCTTYSGYIWNRSSENVNWTFACNVANLVVFHFDGQKMFSHTGGSDKEIAKVTINVAPGAHSFRIGNHSKYYTKNGVPEDKTEGGMSGKNTPWKGMGFRWDPLGRDTTDPANFVILEDPGDGSLFTWAIPGEDVFYPGTEDLIEPAKFDLVKFTGGTLHLNGITNTVSEVEGLPNMAGTGKLIIENKWTIDAADIADKAKADGLSLAFGEDVELVINKNRAVKSSNGTYEWTVFESEDDISGSISVKDSEMAKSWRIEISGKTVKLKYYPAGTVIIVR